MEPINFKRKNLLACFGLFAFVYQVQAQNMVTNATYEAKCLKNGYGEIIKANAWQNANGGSADLFDKKMSHCKTAANGIPYNYMGYQPSGDGQNYAGIVAYYDDGSKLPHAEYTVTDNSFTAADGYKRYTEYLEGEFREPMVAGMVYEVSFRVNLGDKSGRAVSCLGALLTPDRVKQENNTFLTRQPQFISHRIISDSVNWVTLSGAYIAGGGEKYITIGCFKDEDFVMEKVVSDFQNDSRKAYYYISEVSVTPYSSVKPNLDAVLLGMDYVELMNVQFASGSAEIMAPFYQELDEVAAWMKAYPDYKFFVAGYADQQGGNAINDPLSLQRAQSVKRYLVSKGVKSENVITDGFGSSNPIEHKWKSRMNRRVEIYLYAPVKISQL